MAWALWEVSELIQVLKPLSPTLVHMPLLRGTVMPEIAAIAEDLPAL